MGSLPSVVVALSGGVDSSLLAAIASQELPNKAIAVTGISASLPRQELDDIRHFCQSHALKHITVETHELKQPSYRENTPDRCYFCKEELYGQLQSLAKEHQIDTIIDGTHADDLQGHRPGHQAALDAGVRSPLVELAATKHDVRTLANKLNLSSANRPSSPCLSSRIAYGQEVTEEKLEQIERGEAFLKTLGFKKVRLRYHDAIARIEIPKEELNQLIGHAEVIHTHLRELGFTYVTLDLGGYRSGSLLEIVQH